MVSDVHENHKAPGKFCHQVSSGAPDADQGDQVGNDTGGKDGKDQGDVIVKVGTHVATDKIDDCIVTHFCNSLLPGDAGDLQSGAEPGQNTGDDNHDKQGGSQGLDGDLAKQGEIDIAENSCTID